MLATKAGDIDLRIPKLREGSFFPLILEPRRRIDQALFAVVMEAYVTIFVQPDPATVAASWDEVRGQLAGRFPKIGTLMDNAKTEVLAFTAFPRPHWPKIWSTNRWSELTRRSSAEPAWWDISQRTCGHPPRRRHPGRHARRVGVRRTPLPLRGLHGPTRPDQRY